MTETAMLRDAVAAVLGGLAPPAFRDAADGLRSRWTALERLGFTSLGVPETAGGAGGTVADLAVVLYAAGRHGTSLPLVEHALIAGRLAGHAGWCLPGGLAVVAAGGDLTAHREGGRLRLSGEAAPAAWLGEADWVLAMAPIAGTGEIAVVRGPRQDRTVRPAPANLAGEPAAVMMATGRDIADEDWVALPSWVARETMTRGAAGRAVMIAGAVQAVLDVTVRYVGEREQFGRPLSRFQAVAQMVARIASQAALANAACGAAVAALDDPDAEREVWAAKVSTGAAGTEAAGLAHQVIGAVGMTAEHELHRYTRRIWSWRDEYGTDAELARRLFAAARTAPDLWDFVTGRRG